MIRPLERRAGRRQRVLGRIALTVTLTVTAGIGTAAGSAVADTPGASAGPVVISPGARFVPRATIILNAGETGFLTAQEGDDRLRWIDYATGATTVADHRLSEPLTYDVDDFRFTRYPPDFGHGSDTVAVYADSPAPHVTLQQRAGDGPETTVVIPEGQAYVATYGDTVLTRTGAEQAVTSLHLLHLEDGEVRDRRLEGLPEGWDLSVSEGDARSIAVRGIKWEDSHMSQGWWVVDLATGSVKTLSTRGESVSFDRDTIFHVGAPSGDTAQVYRRDDPEAEPTTVDLRDVASYNDVVRPLGDRFVTVAPPNDGNGEYRGNQLVLRDATGSWKSLLAVASPSVHRTPDGSLLLAGAEERTTYGALDWGYYLFSLAADGTVTRKRLADIEDREAEPAGISLGSGILTTADDSKHYGPATTIGGYRSTWLKTAGRPEELDSTVDGVVSGRDDDCGSSEDAYCVTMFASGDGHHGRKASTEQDATVLYRNGAAPWGPQVTSGLGSPQLVDLSGRFGVVNQGWGGQQAVLHFKDSTTGNVVLKRDPVATSVWGDTLWSAVGRWDNTSSGVSTRVEAKNLSTGAAGASFDAGCVPSDLQAVGRWVYWRCSDYWHAFKGAGVYDLQSRTSLGLGPDETLLGDGYLVHRSDAAGLTLLDLHNGLPAGGKEADLPQRLVATAAELGNRTVRRSGWTVDRFGGHVAYTGADRRVRVVPSGVPASQIAVIDSDTPALDIKAGPWKPRWWLSKPAGSWVLTLVDKATGQTVRTLSGGEARGQVAPSWDGKDATGRYVPNGAYSWTLTAKPADGVKSDASTLGTVAVTGGAAVRRDYVGEDGYPDLYARGTDGSLLVYQGNASGTVSAKTAGGTWPTTSALVPFGDAVGDGANDTLVADKDGFLYRYSPERGMAVTPEAPYTKIGSGWAAFDGLTYSGDLTNDRIPDLVARQTATGDLYLFAGTGAGGFTRTGRIGTSWKSLTIVGAGDLNGDGHADLVARTTNGDLYRYYGTGTGTISSGTKIGSGWGGMADFVGIGDLTGDGKDDILGRTTTGDLYRYAGNGTGGIGSGAKIGTGWKSFASVR
ncbi:FG-GAP-like repeat-containing protein [Streptomyces sp. NBC_00178]|uniref:FG-GAP-like repeat-containing protein n=1 Tax=Streptomyces sp. NBC_00178 TaxID=2975672 RepID=UPI002E2E19D0|nr:FG-GAP-like repeat-containing protein [Streptomyces sp. NBC_00178]